MNRRRVLVTGARGFLGKNLIVALRRRSDVDIDEFDVETDQAQLDVMLRSADAVFHLAGVNRPPRPEDFQESNARLTEQICKFLEDSGRAPFFVLSSSTQAAQDNPYGLSKRAAEAAVIGFGSSTHAAVRIFRLPGLFGKWSRPNYNSVVATFCYNTAHGLPLSISDPDRTLELVHVDDVVRSMGDLLDGVEPRRDADFCTVTPSYRVTLGELARRIRSFPAFRSSLEIPDFSDALTRLLYSTFLSYLPKNAFAYSLTQHRDARGELAELLRSPHFGQIFVSRTRPGITRGNHYHDAKVEKFAVMEGDAIIRFRDILGGDVIEYPVTGREFRVVDIPPGYTHNISNVGSSDLIVLFWASEPFNPQRIDTWAEGV